MTSRFARMLRNTLRIGLLAALPSVSAQAEWNQYRGPTDDGISKEKIATQWPADGPKVLWKVPMGKGFGTFALGAGKAFIFAERSGDEACIALDPASGKEIWATIIGPTTTNKDGDPCPRTTPAVDGDRVYIYSTFLKLDCLDAANGKTVWSHDLVKEFAGQDKTKGIKNWGNSVSPLLDGDLVIVVGGGPGASFMAFNKKTGEVAWKTADEKLTHASPTLATLGGVKQVIFFVQSGLVSCDVATGKELWRSAFPFAVSTAASPVVFEDIVYCSAGYGVGGKAIQVECADGAFTTKQLWPTEPEKADKGVVNHWTTPVCKDGYLYGMYGFKEFFKEPLRCVNIRTGKTMWSQDGFGQGGLCLVGDTLVVQGEAGQIVLVEPTSNGYHELANAQLIGKKCWNMAIVSDGRLYARSSSEAVCLDVSGK